MLYDTPEYTTPTSFQQLFGRIESLQLKHGYLVSGHFGKSYDAGCVTVRKFDLRRDGSSPPPFPAEPRTMPPSPSPSASRPSPQLSSASTTSAASLINFSQDLPVVFSRFDDLRPVVNVDFNKKYLFLVQWSVTFRGVQRGNADVFRFNSRDKVVNLSKTAKTTFSTGRFDPDREEILVSASDDGLVSCGC